MLRIHSWHKNLTNHLNHDPHLASSLTHFISLDIGPVLIKENDRTQMEYAHMLPSMPSLRWILALFFLGTTVAVGLYAM